MRPDPVLIADIIEAAQRIDEFTSGLSREEFLSHHMPQSAVVREIAVMGEAANSLTPEFKAENDQIDWRKLIQLRHLYIHTYHRIDYKIVWRTATSYVPRALRQLEAISFATSNSEEPPIG